MKQFLCGMFRLQLPITYSGLDVQAEGEINILLTFCRDVLMILHTIMTLHRLLEERSVLLISKLTLKKIIKRHMYAATLAMFWKEWKGYFGRVDSFSRIWHSPWVLKDFLGQHPEELKKSLKRIIPNNLWDSLGVEDWSWTAGLLNEKDGVLSKAELQLLNDLRELRAVEDECIK